MRLIRILGGLLAGLSLTVLPGLAAGAQPGTVTVGSAGVVRYLEKGQPPVVIHLTVEQAQSRREAKGGAHGPPGGGGKKTKTNDLIYNGGTSVSGVTGTIGVETAPKIYLVLWGSQWSNNDPSQEAATLQSFLSVMGGSSWLNTVTQYCENVSSGTIYCTNLTTGVTSGTAAGNPSPVFAGTLYDENSPAPNKPRQSQIAAEAVRAANLLAENQSAAANDNAQYVIATAHGYNSSGFGTQYCAYHSYTTSSYGDIAYTNLPYITDAGASCGANFNNLNDPKAGITIVEGHEAAETITDPFPTGGWLDSGGSEIGDKCAWISGSGQGAVTDVKFTGSSSYPVQSLWSNAYNSGKGGCVLAYP